jgi:hypothetical protein
LDDARDDDNFYDSRENNCIDGYAGLSAGINVKNVRIEGFVKARQIDGDYWDSDKQIFYGLHLSLFFNPLDIRKINVISINKITTLLKKRSQSSHLNNEGHSDC